MFSFTKARTWKQPKYPSIDEWKKKMCSLYTHTHTHTLEYSHKKKEILPFVETWMDPDSIMPSEISQTEKDKLCFLKKQTKKLYSYKENRLMAASGTGWRVSKMDETIQRDKPSVINKSQGYNIQYSDYS